MGKGETAGYQVREFALKRIENIMGTGETAGYQHLLLFPCFQKDYFSRSRLTRYQKTNFRLFQTNNVCRRQLQI